MVRNFDKAIVTLCVGEGYTANFLKFARPSWDAYCEKHGYDLILLTEPIDKSCDPDKKSIHWQKMLIGLLAPLKEYKHLVWMDGDIVINHRMAPCIVSALGPGKIGAVDISGVFRRTDDRYNLHTRFLLLNYLLARKVDPNTPNAIITDGDLARYHKMLGFEKPADRFINTGVLVFDPNRHGSYLAECYAKYERDYFDFENTPLSYELQNSGRIQYLDGRFNAIWGQVLAEHYPFLFNEDLLEGHRELLGWCVNTAYRNSWFLHFAGGRSNPVIKGAFEMIDDRASSVPEMVFPGQGVDLPDTVEFCRFEEIDETRRGLGDKAKNYMDLY